MPYLLDEPFFQKQDIAIHIPSTDSQGFKITSVVPGDFNNDGIMDLLVMGQKEFPKDGDGEIKLRLYLGKGDGQYNAQYISLTDALAKNGEPLAFDYNGNMHTDLLGYSNALQNGKALPAVWVNQLTDQSGQYKLEMFSPNTGNGTVSEDTHQLCRVSRPHSNAFIDLNGDCRPDLFVTCRENADTPLSYQIWTSNITQSGESQSKQNSFQLALSAKFPNGTGQISFADMDSDGAIDMIYPVCDSNGACSIHVSYNQQTPLCDPSKTSQCRSLTNLCAGDGQPGFETLDRESADHTIFPLKHWYPEETLKIEDSSFQGLRPLSLQIADFNLDGYPDLLFLTSLKNGETRIRLWRSTPCTPATCSPKQVAKGRLYFVPDSSSFDNLDKAKNIRSAFFLDVDNDGLPDIVVVHDTPDQALSFYPNRLKTDALFLKAKVLNNYHDTDLQDLPSTSFPGASIKFSVLDASNKVRVHHVGQLSQSAYSPMLMPYSLVGLGRTNNYIDNFYVGTSQAIDIPYKRWSGIIPNAHLVVSPLVGSADLNADQWRLELFITPGLYSVWVIVSLAATLLLLLVAFLVFDCLERREDSRERRKRMSGHYFMHTF